MTDTEAYELGRRALQAGFQWRPGCVAVTFSGRDSGSVCVGPAYFDNSKPLFALQSSQPFTREAIAPDVRDPGVIGQLWAQLAERTGTHIEIRRSSDGAGWSVGPQDGIHSDLVDMESRDSSRALVAALEMTAG